MVIPTIVKSRGWRDVSRVYEWRFVILPLAIFNLEFVVNHALLASPDVNTWGFAKLDGVTALTSVVTVDDGRLAVDGSSSEWIDA